MTTFDDVLKRVKEQVAILDPRSVADRADADGCVLVDVREREEVADGHLVGALLIPRGVLELRIETAIPDRSTRLILYCEAGTRSALAARALTELGYTDVSSMEGGFTAWKALGLPFEVPQLMSSQQLTRYSRHLVIPEVGEGGQQRLLDARVFLLGAGGLGSPAALYLAAAGVGELTIVDSDRVDRSNLQRQVLHTDPHVGMQKVDSAEVALRALNPDVRVNKQPVRLTADNALELLAGHDVVVDGGDNFTTRYLINDACARLGIPVVHGSVYRFEGQVSTFDAANGPCYRCLYPEPPPAELAPSCQEAGVLGVLPGIIGTLQGLEVLKILLDVGESLRGRLLTFDGTRCEFRELRLGKDPDCPACSAGAKTAPLQDLGETCGAS